MKSVYERGVPGTRPGGVQDEREAAARVREMFGRIAPRYDFLNHLLSLDIDKLWRRRVAKRFTAILHNPTARVLDLCCGTGDLALAFRKEAPAGAAIVGSDFVPEMLERARAKAAASGAGITFVEADALSLPFADGCFDLASCSFGFRNLANYERGLFEIFRVLKPNGVAAILEFAEPRGKLFGSLYRFYFRQVLPLLGGLISGNASAYTYLPSSVSKFPSPEVLQALFERVGYTEARFERWTGGIVALHSARKQ
ncbi:MAG TPA: bifunctional demethylmenaquinone methyltransferase/2-methoxy-6-polyprenyl-1,4-benzoquinol methylase UbiE [Candidatus Acidoferrales bacterium]|jgi:demethylmenaquinone methyltransferase/2-methoxy-6-polyprenyl-1,4-benzoquinol methylase|nr:bifunctional demethylmenaquinone methyltransferase/2-methoxy-6-polyprenyl-1,4-benzoquinol methylase UbiE [Candidatus Acidoferrales bacterium]